MEAIGLKVSPEVNEELEVQVLRIAGAIYRKKGKNLDPIEQLIFDAGKTQLAIITHMWEEGQ